MEHSRRADIESMQEKLERDALRDARMLLVTGSGDPFGSPFLRRWLQTLDRENMPKLERIHLQTNALLWTKRTWRTIPEDIRSLVRSAEISIDAASAETYSINRRGGEFERLIENLEFIGTELRTQGPLEWLKISMVVQQNNFREMPAFVRLAQRYNADQVYFGKLINWGTFTQEEYDQRAVHLESHPEHYKLRDVLGDRIFDEAPVDLGNLTDLRQAVISANPSADPVPASHSV